MKDAATDDTMNYDDLNNVYDELQRITKKNPSPLPTSYTKNVSRQRNIHDVYGLIAWLHAVGKTDDRLLVKLDLMSAPVIKGLLQKNDWIRDKPDQYTMLMAWIVNFRLCSNPELMNSNVKLKSTALRPNQSCRKIRLSDLSEENKQFKDVLDVSWTNLKLFGKNDLFSRNNNTVNTDLFSFADFDASDYVTETVLGKIDKLTLLSDFVKNLS